MATFLPGAASGTSNGTTFVTVVPSPTSGLQRMAKSIKIRNADTAQNQITVFYVDSNLATFISVAQVILDVGDHLQFNENDLEVLDTTQKSIQFALTNPITSTEWQWDVAWTDVGP